MQSITHRKTNNTLAAKRDYSGYLVIPKFNLAGPVSDPDAINSPVFLSGCAHKRTRGHSTAAGEQCNMCKMTKVHGSKPPAELRFHLSTRAFLCRLILKQLLPSPARSQPFMQVPDSCLSSKPIWNCERRRFPVYAQAIAL